MKASAVLDGLDGYKTYIAAVGLFGLALYQASVGQYDQAVQTFLSALATAGLRHAVAKTDPRSTNEVGGGR